MSGVRCVIKRDNHLPPPPPLLPAALPPSLLPATRRHVQVPLARRGDDPLAPNTAPNTAAISLEAELVGELTRRGHHAITPNEVLTFSPLLALESVVSVAHFYEELKAEVLHYGGSKKPRAERRKKRVEERVAHLLLKPRVSGEQRSAALPPREAAAPSPPPGQLSQGRTKRPRGDLPGANLPETIKEVEAVVGSQISRTEPTAPETFTRRVIRRLGAHPLGGGTVVIGESRLTHVGN
jgi:hypothetical protein